MSVPNIPDLNPEISICKKDAVNILLTSIGMEELSLAHILNAEAEKIQFALGTLEGCENPLNFCEIKEVNEMANKMLKDVIKKEILLNMKLEDVIDIIKS